MSLPFILESPGGGTGLTGTGIARDTGACTELSGDVTTSGSNVTTLKNTGTSGTYTKVTTDAQGRVSSGTTLAAGDIPNLDASKITSGVLAPARGGVAPTPAIGWFIPHEFYVDLGEGTTTIAANAIRISPFLVKQTIGPFTTMTIRQNSIATAANGNHYVSIFDNTGALVVAGKAACTTTGATNVAMTVGSTTLVPGQYWVAWGTDCTNTVTWIATSVPANGKWALLPNQKVIGFQTGQISGGAMATSITISSFTASQGSCILVCLS